MRLVVLFLELSEKRYSLSARAARGEQRKHQQSLRMKVTEKKANPKGGDTPEFSHSTFDLFGYIS